MKIYRLSREKYSKELSGKGASNSGNRWNSKGTEIIYCASSKALAMAEIAVHISLALLPNDFLMIEIDVPESIIIGEIDEKNLQEDWNVFPHSLYTQQIGDEFIKQNKYCILKVPSAVVKGDINFLVNPYHPDFGLVKISNSYHFPFDKRLFL
ncbi:MAG: RES superfamily protein [Bacteroidetes bacterium HGW-Bacteroidetes-3]|jgi:RES domain-containing protein|nr:MAG: RES superfamily protein [Bacteroidetes bacterium HGW-Bacteroidetes-3]